MDVIVLEDDRFWRSHIVKSLRRHGHVCHAYEGSDFTPDALVGWRNGLAIQESAVISDISLDFDLETAAFDTVRRWQEAGFECRPMIFISGGDVDPGDERRARECGGTTGVIKHHVEDWNGLLEQAGRGTGVATSS